MLGLLPRVKVLGSWVESLSLIQLPFFSQAEGEQVEEDSESTVGDRSQGEGLRRVFQMLFSLYPEAVPKSDPAPVRASRYEGMFSGQAKAPKEEYSPVLFHRVGEIFSEVWKVCGGYGF